MLQRFDTASLVPTPWKNGGGSTVEIVCRPDGATMESFDWRVSIATIAQDGPFSVFPGVDRAIMLLDGDGLALRYADGVIPRLDHQIDHQLDQPHTPFSFAGDASLDCRLLGARSTDFNVMTRRGAWRAQVSVLHAATELLAATCGVIMALRGTWWCEGIAPAATLLTSGQGLWWDGSPRGGRLNPLKRMDAALVWVRLTQEA